MKASDRERDVAAEGGLTARQVRSLALAGTVVVPSPVPALGRIEVGTYGLSSREVKELDDPTTFEAVRFFQKVHVEIVHEVNRRLTITRVVKLGDIAAAFLPEDPGCVTMTRGHWYLAADLEARVLARLEEVQGRDLPALVPLLSDSLAFLPESARVLLRIEAGMTAAESVEYYPPAPGERSSAFRNIFCDGAVFQPGELT